MHVIKKIKENQYQDKWTVCKINTFYITGDISEFHSFEIELYFVLPKLSNAVCSALITSMGYRELFFSAIEFLLFCLWLFFSHLMPFVGCII